jgi:hypothetical protein
MAKVEIIKLGHAHHKGERGEKEGGAPSKDSVWGIAFVGGSLVTFGGRKGGKLRFKARRKADLPAVIDQFNNEKITGYPFGKNLDCRYTEIDPAKCNELVEGMEEQISKHYYAAVKAGTINKRATEAAPKAEAAPKVKADKPAAKPKAEAKVKAAPKAKAKAKAEPKAKRQTAHSVPAGYGGDSAETTGTPA